MSSHVRVEIGAGDAVSIALPTFMVKVCRAVEGLNHEAAECERKAGERAARAADLEPLVGAWLCAGDLVREHREHAAEHRRYAGYLRTLAGEVEKLRGEYIAIAGLLR